MFSGFRPIRPLPEEDIEYLSDEQRYWNRLKEVSVFQESGNITNLDFMPVNPYYLASSCFNRLTIYDTVVSEPIATFSRFKSSVSCIAYRPDGNLLGGATEAGEVQFFNVHKHQFSKEGRALKRPIRSFYNAHKAQVNALAYEAPAYIRFVSMGDDGLAKLWDLADTRADNSEAIWRCVAHPNKKVLTGVFSRSNAHLLVTGSDDNTIRLWDTRTKGGKASSNILEMEHGGPVNKVLLFQNDSICVSAGASTVKLWDITAGGKLLYTFENHTRNVTSLSFASNQKCLLTAGLDRRIHAFSCDSGDFSLIKSWKTAAPVLSLATSNDDQWMAYGMSNLLSIHQRKNETEISTDAFGSAMENFVNNKSKNEENAEQEEEVLLKNGKRKSFIYNRPEEPIKKCRVGLATVQQRERGNVDEPQMVELSARHLDKMFLGSLDYMLRNKRYREMVVTMVTKDLLTQNPAIVVSAFQQIRIRQKLPQALSGHTSDELAPLLEFIRLNLFRTTFFDILCEVLNVFFTLYAEEDMSSDVRKSINSLRDTIQTEISLQCLIGKTHGILNMLIGTTTQNPAKRRPISSSTLPLNGFSTTDADGGEQKPKLIDSSPLNKLANVEWKL